MLALPELQAAFGQSMTSEMRDTVLALVACDAPDAAARLAIYRNNFLSRLTKSLRETFPVVCRLVDERFFSYAAAAYIRTDLPTEGCLAEYGHSFPAFLAAFPLASEVPYLRDVATLEWSIHRAHRAAALPTLPLTALSGIDDDPAEVQIRMAPWLDYLALGYNVDEIWSAHQADGLLGGLQLVSTDLLLQVYGLDELRFTRLSPATWVFRSALAVGDTLGQAAALTIGTFPQFDLTQALSLLFSERCVVGLDSNASKHRVSARIAQRPASDARRSL